MSSQKTKERILDTAEKLFAEHGLSATSLRSIITKAEVNLAAVHYHFGSREELILAVYKRRLEPLNAKRLTLLTKLEDQHGKGPIPVEDLMEAFIGPALELSRGTRHFMQLMGRMHSETNEVLRSLIVEQFSEVAERFNKALVHTLPSLPGQELAWRFYFTIGAMAFSLMNVSTPKKLGAMLGEQRDITQLKKRLVRFVSAGLRAKEESDEK